MATHSGGALADFGRLPPERKALVFIVIGVVLGALYFQFVFKSLNSDLDEARATRDRNVSTTQQQAKDIPNYDKEREHMKSLRKTIDDNQKALPTEAELPAFYETLNHKMLESGVELANWSQQKEQNVESFIKVPVSIEVSGTFLQIKRFFASLAQKSVGTHDPTADDSVEHERIVSIENLELTDPKIKNGAIVLTAKFTAATFRQADNAVPAAAAAATAPTSGSAAPPPMPSAATPAGAKARVENSLDKGAARNANATGVDEAKTPSAGSARLQGGI